MPTETRLHRHERLVHRMAETQGVDLDEAVLRGKLTPDALDAAVLACTGCAEPCACAVWLSAETRTEDGTPAYCRNGTLFAGLTEAGQ